MSSSMSKILPMQLFLCLVLEVRMKRLWPARGPDQTISVEVLFPPLAASSAEFYSIYVDP